MYTSGILFDAKWLGGARAHQSVKHQAIMPFNIHTHTPIVGDDDADDDDTPKPFTFWVAAARRMLAGDVFIFFVFAVPLRAAL